MKNIDLEHWIASKFVWFNYLGSHRFWDGKKIYTKDQVIELFKKVKNKDEKEKKTS